jgi:hypothetical protein
LKERTHAPAEKRHYGVLQEDPPQDGRGRAEHARKVGELEGEPHAEHDDLKSRCDQPVVEKPHERGGIDQRYDTAEGDPEGKEPNERRHEVAM